MTLGVATDPKRVSKKSGWEPSSLPQGHHYDATSSKTLSLPAGGLVSNSTQLFVWVCTQPPCFSSLIYKRGRACAPLGFIVSVKEGDTRKESNMVPALHEMLFLPHSVHLLFNRMKETDPKDWVYLRCLWERNMQNPTSYSGSCDSSIEVFVLFFPQIFGFMYIHLLLA